MWGRESLARAAVLLGALILRFGVWRRPIAFLDDTTLIDDSYLSFTVARNLARGLGPLYGIAPTNGFQPLWVWILTPVYRFLLRDPWTPIHVALALSLLCDLAGMWILYRLVRRITGMGPVALITIALWAVSPYAIGTSLNGLETSLTFLFLVGSADALAAAWLQPARLSSGRHMGALGLWLGLAALARVDSLLLFPFAGLHLIACGRRGARDPGRTRGALLVALGVACAIAAVWPVVSWFTTRTVFPVSGEAVRYMVLSALAHRPGWSTLYGPMLAEAALVIARKNVVVLGLATGLGCWWVVRRQRSWPGGIARRLAPIAPVLGFGVAIAASYALVIFGHWHFPRYLFPVSLVLALLFAVGLSATLERIAAPRTYRLLLLAVALVGIAGHLLTPSFRRLLAARSTAWGYLPIGLWARDYFPPGTVIGGSQTGALGYFADRLVVINLDGVVNRDCYEAMRAGRAADYVREAGIRWLVWQDDVEFLARESGNAAPLVLRAQGEVPGIRTRGTPWRVFEVSDPSRPSR